MLGRNFSNAFACLSDITVETHELYSGGIPSSMARQNARHVSCGIFNPASSASKLSAFSLPVLRWIMASLFNLDYRLSNSNTCGALVS